MGGPGSGNRHPNSPFAGMRADKVDPADNSRRIAYMRALGELPPLDLSDAEAVDERIATFYSMCDEYGMHPLIGNFATSLGMNRGYLWQIVNGERPGKNINPLAKQSIQKNIALLDMNYEQTLTTVKNPVPWIFLGKAAFNWKEQPTETVIRHESSTPRLEGGTREEIAAKYAEIVGVEDVRELPAGEQEEEA